MRNFKINPIIIISICIFTFLIWIFLFGYIINRNTQRKQYSESIINIFEKNKNPIFSINEIALTSNANAIDNSQDKKLQNLSIYQFADIALKINNGDESTKLTNENTIKKLYIDNISFETNSQKGEKSLIYTNSLKMGKNEEIVNAKNEDKIEFNIVNTNKQNNNADYDKPTFYADCSNPISLKYINKDIVTGYNLEKGKSITFDGKLLKKAGITKSDLECKVKFRINIINNNDKYFNCWINFNIPIDELLDTGKTIKHAGIQDVKYNFYCM